MGWDLEVGKDVQCNIGREHTRGSGWGGSLLLHVPASPWDFPTYGAVGRLLYQKALWQRDIPACPSLIRPSPDHQEVLCYKPWVFHHHQTSTSGKQMILSFHYLNHSVVTLHIHCMAKNMWASFYLEELSTQVTPITDTGEKDLLYPIVITVLICSTSGQYALNREHYGVIPTRYYFDLTKWKWSWQTSCIHWQDYFNISLNQCLYLSL